MKKLIFTLIITSLAATVAFSQHNTKCQNFINNIEKLYNQGNYVAIISEFDSVQHCKYSKQQRLRIYKYLIPSYSTLGFDSLTDVYSRKFLLLNPFYKYSPDDPIELQNLTFKYDIFPKFTVGYMGGINNVMVDKIMVFNMLDSIDYETRYSSRSGILSQLLGEVNFTRHFSTGISLGVLYYNYRRTLYAYRVIQINYIERGSEFFASSYAKFKFNFSNPKNLVTYLRSGVYVSFTPNFSGELNYHLFDTIYHNLQLPYVTEIYFNLPAYTRNQLRYGIELNLGTGLNLQRFTLFFELGYQHDLVPYVTPKGIYVSQLTNNFYYVSDLFYLTKLTFRTGFSFNFNYKVEKKLKKL